MVTLKGNTDMVLPFVLKKTQKNNNNNYKNKQKAKEHKTYRINI